GPRGDDPFFGGDAVAGGPEEGRPVAAGLAGAQVGQVIRRRRGHLRIWLVGFRVPAFSLGGRLHLRLGRRLCHLGKLLRLRLRGRGRPFGPRGSFDDDRSVLGPLRKRHRTALASATDEEQTEKTNRSAHRGSPSLDSMGVRSYCTARLSVAATR